MSETIVKPKNEELGALWIKKDAKGRKYFTGEIKVGNGKLQFVGFSNKFKEDNPKQPDYRIYKSKPFDKSAPKSSAPRTEDAEISL